MSEEILYHPSIFIPEWFTMPVGRAKLKYSRHALYATNNDRYGAIPVFDSIPLSQFTLVELGVRKPKINQLGIPAKRVVSKIVVRGRFDKTRDLVFVLVPQKDDIYVVKTVWYNLRSDEHKTLDKTRYQIA